jgi:HK97 family phage portal protein
MNAKTAPPVDSLPVRVLRALRVVSVDVPPPDEYVAGSDFASSPAVTQPYSAKTAASALIANPWLYKAVNIIAQAYAGLPLVLQRKTANGYEDVEEHEVLDLFKAPVPWMTSYQWRAQMMLDLIPFGNAYLLESGAVDGGVPAALIIAEPHRCKIIPGPNGGPLALEYDEMGAVRSYDWADVVHIRTPSCSPDLGRLYGTGIVQPMDPDLRSDIALAIQMRKKAEKGRPDAAYVPRKDDKEWGPKHVKDYQRQLDRTLQSNTGGIPVMSGAGKFEAFDWSVADLGGTDIREWNRSLVFAMTGVPPTLMAQQSANYATSEMEYRFFIEQTLKGWAMLVEDVLNSWLVRKGYPDLRFVHVLPDPEESSQVRIANAVQMWQMGVDPAEALAYFGFDDVPEAAFPQVEQAPAESGPDVSTEIGDVEAQATALAEMLTSEDEEDIDIRPDLNTLLDMVSALLSKLRGTP